MYFIYLTVKCKALYLRRFLFFSCFLSFLSLTAVAMSLPPWFTTVGSGGVKLPVMWQYWEGRRQLRVVDSIFCHYGLAACIIKWMVGGRTEKKMVGGFICYYWNQKGSTIAWEAVGPSVCTVGRRTRNILRQTLCDSRPFLCHRCIWALLSVNCAVERLLKLMIRFMESLLKIIATMFVWQRHFGDYGNETFDNVVVFSQNTKKCLSLFMSCSKQIWSVDCESAFACGAEVNVHGDKFIPSVKLSTLKYCR